MATIYFLKQLAQNKITDRHGKIIPFERCSESRGIIELSVPDEGQSSSDPRAIANQELVADLQKYIADKKGGVSLIDEATYDHIKKNEPHIPKAPLNVPKLFDPTKDPFSPKVSAAGVGAQGVASPVGETGSAAPAPARGGAGLSRPVSKGRPVRTGRAGQAAPAAPAVAEAPSAPAPESPAPSQVESAAVSESPAPSES